ncbi:MAG: alanine/ornithine racemase family PLP-dependent enzyme [Clostridiales bacterium]|nr:alanine/ornithine racemase family PLP-dependent enzyme [Clostridiales bacterium]
MNSGTYLDINLSKIEENAKRIVERCKPFGIDILGVTKGFTAIPRIVEAMIRGGIDRLADSRMENIISLRKKGFTQSISLLRIPRLSSVKSVVEYADYSVNSELSVIKGLSKAAKAAGKNHKIILMIDVGDLREGVLPEDALDIAKETTALEAITLSGIGTNMGCYGGVLPTIHNLSLLIETAKEVESITGAELEFISGGGTSSLKLIESNEMPAGINQLRIGEGILLGTDTTHDYRIPWLHQDAFLLKTEVIEVKIKPSIPIGKTGRDAFGNIPVFSDNGLRKRAIVALGRQDVNIDGLIPFDPNMIVLGASSDHMVIDITDSEQNIAVGDLITFKLNYQGLLFLCNSKYVSKVFY